jgi:hypothetical protein
MHVGVNLVVVMLWLMSNQSTAVRLSDECKLIVAKLYGGLSAQ